MEVRYKSCCSIHFAVNLAGLKNIARYTVNSKFHCIIKMLLCVLYTKEIT